MGSRISSSRSLLDSKTSEGHNSSSHTDLAGARCIHNQFSNQHHSSAIQATSPNVKPAADPAESCKGLPSSSSRNASQSSVHPGRRSKLLRFLLCFKEDKYPSLLPNGLVPSKADRLDISSSKMFHNLPIMQTIEQSTILLKRKSRS